MLHKFQEWAQREHRTPHRVLSLVAGGAVFGFGVPIVLVALAAWLDRILHLPRLIYGQLNISLGLLMAFGGWALAAWAVQVQVVEGRGTPVPLVPTRNLVVRGPYAYCRNPMALGVILFYLGVAVWLGSPAVLVAVLLIAAVLLLYFRYIEEKELEMRFGQAYLEYKRTTPFLIPRLRR
ncbi:MAG: isoprenylcysteine carboxylmethyltransferase family protein [Caldilineae bacterium]|nr:MAG: isoprenylcysteine carboxylmethyltransferase family protein [Caldilineae bacterium]